MKRIILHNREIIKKKRKIEVTYMIRNKISVKQITSISENMKRQ